MTISLDYTGGNGGAHPRLVFQSTVASNRISGLTATLEAGNVANGNGTVTLTINGTPTKEGLATFELLIGGRRCRYDIAVGCGAMVAPGVWKSFMCHNLSSDYNADPLVPSAAIHGAKYQWGAKTGEAGRYYSQANDQTNSGIISGWIQTALPNDTWRNASKTANDPCPTGYRVPTATDWSGVISNNGTPTVLGTWTDSPSNYGAAIQYTLVMLPVAGSRMYDNGTLVARGVAGYYWSSNFLTNNIVPAQSQSLAIYSSNNVAIRNDYRTLGHSVRCIAQ